VQIVHTEELVQVSQSSGQSLKESYFKEKIINLPKHLRSTVSPHVVIGQLGIHWSSKRKLPTGHESHVESSEQLSQVDRHALIKQLIKIKNVNYQNINEAQYHRTSQPDSSEYTGPHSENIHLSMIDILRHQYMYHKLFNKIYKSQ